MLYNHSSTGGAVAGFLLKKYSVVVSHYPFKEGATFLPIRQVCCIEKAESGLGKTLAPFIHALNMSPEQLSPEHLGKLDV